MTVEELTREEALSTVQCYRDLYSIGAEMWGVIDGDTIKKYNEARRTAITLGADVSNFPEETGGQKK